MNITDKVASAVTGTANKAMDATVGNAKQRQLAMYTQDDTSKDNLTTFTGAKVEKTDVSLHAGERGPALVNDFHAREKVSHFDHERISERVVHARGAAAHGTFKLHTAIPEFTKAGILNDTGATTPIFLRFSTVAGARGSADSVRDVRGFALRMYTSEGNWDIVGNNSPVFHIQDGIQFPDLVHALKPQPHNEIPQAQTAHDNAWDFLSLSPVSTHMQMWMLSDRTIPQSFRKMPGFGVNTFRLVNGDGKSTFCKFHFRPHLGTHSLVWDEALKLAGQDPDFHRRDLWEAIEAGAYPKWDFGVQLVAEEDEHKFDFDLLDATKIIPEDLVPVKYIGEFQLDRNVDNYFAETEQVAFCTSHIVPGIDFSDDPLLAWRNFSYFDTQISRLGINFGQIPINRPVCPMRVNHRDGQHTHDILKNRTPYWPNRNSTLDPAPVTSQPGGALSHYPAKVSGVQERAHGPKFKDYYSQAQLFYNSMSDVEKQHMVDAAQFELGKCDEIVVQQNFINNINKVDHDFALKIAEGFTTLTVPDEVNPNPGHKSAFLSQVSGKDQVFTATGRKIGVYCLPGYSYAVVAELKAALAAKGVIVMIVGPAKGPVKASNGSAFDTQFTFETCRSTHFDAVAFIGAGNDEDSSYNEKLKQMGRIRHAAVEAYMHQKAVIFHGTAVQWGVSIALSGEFSPDAASETSKISVEKGVVFVPSAGAGIEMNKVIMDEMAKHRCWERDVSHIAA